MRRITLGIALAALLVSGVAQAEEAHRAVVDAIMRDVEARELVNIRDFCADQWGADCVMRKHCVAESRAAMRKASTFDTTASAANMDIFLLCGQQWADGKGRTDWVMMSYCLDEQLAAKAALE